MVTSSTRSPTGNNSFYKVLRIPAYPRAFHRNRDPHILCSTRHIVATASNREQAVKGSFDEFIHSPSLAHTGANAIIRSATRPRRHTHDRLRGLPRQHQP